MALPALDAFVGVEAADAGRFLDCLHALAVHDRGARIGMATQPLQLGTMQGIVEKMPDASHPEAPKVIKDRLPRREVGREVAPGAARAQDIENRIQDAARWMRTRSAPFRQEWKMAAKVALLRGYPAALQVVEAAWDGAQADDAAYAASDYGDAGVALLLVLGSGEVVCSTNLAEYLEHQGSGG